MLTAKGAKNAKKISEYLPQRRQGAMVGKAEVNSFEDYFFIPNLASLRLGARKIRIQGFLTPEKFALAAQILRYCNMQRKSNDSELRALRALRADKIQGAVLGYHMEA